MNEAAKKEWTTRLYLTLLLPVALFAVAWAIYGLPLQRMNLWLPVIAVVTIFFSSYLRIQLPRTKIHLTISDALIFLSMLLYGGEVAVLLGMLESGFASLNFRRQGIMITKTTMVINVAIATVSVFVTAAVVSSFFGPPELALRGATATHLVLVLFSMAAAQFVVNSILVSAFIAIKSEERLWRVWNEYCLNALVMYISGALVAGLLTKAAQEINIFLFAAVGAFFALVYLTYVRYVNDIKRTSAAAHQSERARAEQAEKHVKELEHYVTELEKTAEALAESREKFKHAAYHDDLTGLPNRGYFIDRINELLEHQRTSREPKFAVMFLDLNRFKTLNDSLGHSMGDLLITHVGARLQNNLSRNCAVGRFGGDEFAILVESFDGTDEVIRQANEISRQLAEPYSLNGRQVYSSVSIGIAFGDDQYKRADDILRDSDIAMYCAKEAQKPFEVFDRQMHERAVNLLDLETDLRAAIKRREFELFYQPIINLDNVRVAGFEALARWAHPTRGIIAPADFIPVAETTGMIVPITVQLLRDACKQICAWQELTAERLIVSVNLSGRHFAHPGLVEQISNIVDETGVQASCLKLEITESAVMENAENAIATLKRIKETGVKISIDDFGTGYSSLSYLHRFPIDTLKVDRSFVATMEDGSENGEIVRTVIALARALKLDVVAEGIESVHQFHQLRILGCEFGQGFLFSRPLPVDEIERLIIGEVPWKNILNECDFGIVARNAELTQFKWTQ